MKELIRTVKKDMQAFDFIYMIEKMDDVRICINCLENIRRFDRIKVYWETDDNEKQTLKILYYTYEFSDRFKVISQKKCFPSIFSYVDTGLLTMDEAWEALLRW